jgi:hypothetical protein
MGHGQATRTHSYIYYSQKKIKCKSFLTQYLIIKWVWQTSLTIVPVWEWEKLEHIVKSLYWKVIYFQNKK